MNTQSIKNFQQNIINEIENKKNAYINISHQIHNHPEIGNEEFFSSKLLIDTLEKEGFSVEKAVAGHPTSFIARKKSNKNSGAAIGFLAEYDALPNLGHACGHNIIGTASTAAAISLSKLIDEIGGEIIVFGTPAEEGGENGSAKASFVKYNLFDSVDACLMIHPGNDNYKTVKSLANDPIQFEFSGKAAHAAACPEKGINALDGVIQLFNGINALRQHVTSDVRIHGIITDGGYAPNIVPDYARAKFFIRASERSSCDQVTEKVKNIARGAALITGAKVNISFFQNKIDNFLINDKFDEVFAENLELLGVHLKNKIPEGLGSTDAGNVSHVVPTIHPHIKIGDDKLVGHTPEFREAAISKQGDEALIIGSKALALTGLALLTDKDKLNAIKEDFSRQHS
ncbi:M20 family metallopeptidase [Clostridium luticellarii]|uniref:Peptidase M20 domain-containing protein 2 n=1 Tax=Clostridium luticellarii TaxID=1691940 RepID=A0A2T0BP43_9CLOT|nr:M20 family metallopeptidase [Clostridium luticellarii]MCI1945073.1 M20 family metallopeptidase [Clostridium luticellarii]MCI1968566.1 M20 family metallopeptidase [Clostridium luticellarii]MCI1996828.1 M20 family metallopeptidase [Clostridium luticellarii]MCI2041099.1 M20 family metallopeptidase [Clostridium luticellarii]PRR85592.1 p-aminobenzoyl-glutamate hydrolase subunit B [Clostridium luticellarii]